MKTLAVLTALVGLASAAPAPQNNFQPIGFPQNGFPGLDTSGAFHPADFNAEINGPVVSARSNLGFNNPVIVKKKTGLHVYRDSTEERADADPREKCGKQVRVKFCDDTASKSADLKRSTKNDKLSAPKDDVQDSIKLAKEAVESLQRDLKTIDHKNNGKSAQWKHGETDKDLHEDIEAARLALETAQKNFGNFESMNLRAATLKDSEALHDIIKGKTEEERIAQYKLAIENIQRNVEIARNIEDSFKAAEDHSSFLNGGIDTTKFMRNNNQGNSDHKTMKETTSSASSSRMSIEENMNKKTQTSKSEHHNVAETKMVFGEEMKSAASETVQVKLENPENHQKPTQAKLADVSLNLNTPLTQNTNNNKPLTKEVGLNTDASERSAHDEDKVLTQHKSMGLNMMHSNNAHKVTLANEMTAKTAENEKNSDLKTESTNMMKTFESHSFQGNEHKSMQQGKSTTNEWKSDKHVKQEKSTWAQTEQKDMMSKSAEHKQEKMQHSTSGLDTNPTSKSSEHSTEHKSHVQDAETFVKTSGLSLHSDMKLADNMELASDINLNAPLNVHLNTDNSMQGKSADTIKESEMEHARVVGFHKKGHHEHAHFEHGHHDHGHHGYSHGHIEHGHGHGHGYGHHGHGYHGKAAEFDNAMHPSMQTEIKEFSEKSAMENMLQWKHHHDAAKFSEKSAMENLLQWKHHHDGARSAYGIGSYGGSGLAGGAYGAGGAGAVGVFPHAKVGGCGIPLLLSCSPSVVSGSLAKPHGYAAAAPAYRSDEESKLKNKRDIIKTKETSMKKIKDVAKTTKSKDLEIRM